MIEITTYKVSAMNLFLKLSIIFFLLTLGLHAEREKIKASILMSRGVSLGAYDATAGILEYFYLCSILKVIQNIDKLLSLVVLFLDNNEQNVFFVKPHKIYNIIMF